MVVISNSWLGNVAGRKYIKSLGLTIVYLDEPLVLLLLSGGIYSFDGGLIRYMQTSLT